MVRLGERPSDQIRGRSRLSPDYIDRCSRPAIGTSACLRKLQRLVVRDRCRALATRNRPAETRERGRKVRRSVGKSTPAIVVLRMDELVDAVRRSRRPGSAIATLGAAWRRRPGKIRPAHLLPACSENSGVTSDNNQYRELLASRRRVLVDTISSGGDGIVVWFDRA